MKAWDWISTRRSLEDVVKNAFEETTMKNVPIDQFWSFKWRNRVQNWDLRKKLNKIGPVGNFDFWSKVNAKVKVNYPRSKSTVSANGSDPCSPGRVGPGQRSARWRGADEATLLTWLADVSDDVSRANVEWWRHQVTSDDVSSSVSARAKSTGVWRRCQKPRWRVEARTTSYDHQILRLSRSVDSKAAWAAHGPRRRSGSEEFEAARGRFSRANCGPWRRVVSFRLTGFLGFPRGRPRSMSVVSVSTGEGLMCTDLIGRDTDCLAWGSGHSSEPWRLRDAVESISSRQTCVTSDSDVYMRIFFAC